ncbi:amidohydrolase [Flavobacterium sp.]|uniref:amidohydrolase n=1 Tax=Flavobacterium sp. TaxID=239 RepID=UPI002FDA5BD8
MRVTLIQAPLAWEDPSQNRAYFESQLNQVTDSDLIVLPEMFTSGFTMNPACVAESMTGITINWLKKTAQKKGIAITGSLVISENHQFYNRMVFVFPNGNLEYYDKKHLFSLAGEDKVYQPGNVKKIISFKGWKICLQVCYDLRFPVFVRNLENYDCIIYVANWPSTRINAWDALLKARAIENLCCVIGVNRVGNDSNGLQYTGHSQVIDELGNCILEPQKEEGHFTVTMSLQKIHETREKLNFLKDKDSFTANWEVSN